jgi:hypothetical protein
MHNIKYLLRYLQSHDVDCWVKDGQIFAVSVFTKPDAPGEVFGEEVALEPSKEAVRAFLGY